jgi:Capsule polysaccharide biosynthesis protein
MRSPLRVFKSRMAKAFKHPRVNLRFVEWFTSMVSHPRGFATLQYIFKRSRWYYLMLAHIQGKKGDHRAAFRTLMLGQRVSANEPLIHIKLSAIHRDNVNIAAAHTHLRIAELLRPGYSTIRRLTFEMDQQLYSEGFETLDKALDLPPKLLGAHMPVLNRVSIYYPEHGPKLIEARKVLMERLRTDSYETPEELSDAVSIAIANRWLRLALEISRNTAVELLPTVRNRLTRLEKNLGGYLSMLDMAWENETSDVTHALARGQAFSLAGLEIRGEKIVELFIPPAIFDYPREEKQTHETIRQTFFHIIPILMEDSGAVIVPRMQLDWRQCFPKTRGARIISYHTRAPFDQLRLHVQEAPFAGYCSFDHSGFAGFASTATDHSAIRSFVANIPDEELESNHREMVARFVDANVSKYSQSADSGPLPENYVFVALQVSTDVVAQLGFMSGMELLESVMEHYRGTDTRVVVKRHPFCRSMKVQECLEQWEASGNIVRSNNSIHDILKNAKVVFTINSGVGLEALMHGKTVVVGGSCDYCYAAKVARSRDELRTIMKGDLTPDRRRLLELLYFFVRRFAIPATDSKGIRSRLEEWLV